MSAELDCFLALPTTHIGCLDDGFVRLVDAMPRLVPEGRTPEFAIVRSARVSYGLGLKSIEEDDKLLRYLVKHQHTSPLESVKFTFHIRCPLFVAVHFIRHRTANINMFSQRYAEIKDDCYYHPNPRAQSKKNKQSSDFEYSLPEEAVHVMEETHQLLNKVFENYHRMIELGMAKEVARYCLPQATYTEFYFTMDMNNLLRFFRLRCDRDHAQHETVVFAEAMLELIRPLVPTLLEDM